jgi:triosephosphate isomerase
MRRKLVAGNWKCNGSLASNDALLGAIASSGMGNSGTGCVVLAPFPYLQQVRTRLAGSGIAWGAQNVSEFGLGAFTGEVAAEMLVELGCSHVVIGHSERRTLLHEDDETVARKVKVARRAGLVPIVCVGETLAERESGRAEQVVSGQVNAVLNVEGGEVLDGAVVAYEPVWAIGTGRTASPEQAQDMHAFIREVVRKRSGRIAESLPILYGGSVKAGNASALFAMPDIDGALVGGASLVAEEFVNIWRAAAAGGR